MKAVNGIKLINPSSAHLGELVTWVSTADQLRQWAGPNMNYPCDVDTLKQDLFANNWPSFSLVSEGQNLLGFGQYYLRAGRCHLSRLIVAPSQRGNGIANTLIELISHEARVALNVTPCSLFVYTHNHAAIKAYQKLGFKMIDSPENQTMEDCIYMVKP